MKSLLANRLVMLSWTDAARIKSAEARRSAMATEHANAATSHGRMAAGTYTFNKTQHAAAALHTKAAEAYGKIPALPEADQPGAEAEAKIKSDAAREATVATNAKPKLKPKGKISDTRFQQQSEATERLIHRNRLG